MFGLSFTEIMMLLLVGIVVVGPRKLPALMGSAGRWIRKIRQMSNDLRSQSGLDELIRQEGLEKELRELRSLSRSNMLTNLVETASRPLPPKLPPKPSPATAPATGEASSAPPAAASPTNGTIPSSAVPGAVAPRVAPKHPNDPVREREYPVIGCDAYGALPDDLDDPALYDEPLPAQLAADPGSGEGPASPEPEAAAGGTA